MVNDPLEVIFFDAAGTLFDIRGSVGEVYGKIARRYGLNADAKQLETDFGEAFRAKCGEGFCSDGSADLALQERSWWFEVVRRVMAGRLEPSVLPRYFDDVFDFFRTSGAWKLYPDTRETLQRLNSLGYRLAVISNFDSRLYDLLADLGIGRQFEKVIVSWQVGAAKPDTRIFRRALEIMCVPASRSAHVGDSILEDLEGARAAGLRAILLDRKGDYAQMEDKCCCRTLSGLMPLLEH